jgi:hypothetical protein
MNATRQRRRPRGWRPLLEVLEGRCVLTTLMALDSDAPHLLVFDSATPGAIIDNVQVSGLLSGDTLQGIRFRPSTNALYALGSDGRGTSRLYTVDLVSGAATLLSPAAGFPGGGSFDFDPVTDQIRLIGSDGTNRRLDPATGTVVATDTSLKIPPGPGSGGIGIFGVSPIAYDRKVPGDTATTLFGLGGGLIGGDFGGDALVTIGSVNGCPIRPIPGSSTKSEPRSSITECQVSISPQAPPPAPGRHMGSSMGLDLEMPRTLWGFTR